jgi:hypothetical protein
VVGLCKFFGPGVLPSQVLKEDASVLRLVDVYRAGHRDEEPEGGD